MLEVPNIAVPLGRSGATPAEEARAVRAGAARRLRIAESDINRVDILRRSIDARRGHEVRFIYTAAVQLRGGANAERALLGKLERRGKQGRARLWEPRPTLEHPRAERPLEHRPVVVGAGCAGLFCALELALSGLEPLLVERGDPSAERTAHVRRFNATGKLDTESNIQFGLGGAGTFSDGKLATGTKSPVHRQILQAFVDAGAPADILVDAKPHIGSDLLPQVVDAIVARIRELGGEVRFRTKLTGLLWKGSGSGRSVAGVELETREPAPRAHGVGREDGAFSKGAVAAGEAASLCGGVVASTEGVPAPRRPLPEDGAFDIAPGIARTERVWTPWVVLACGHSARDVFQILADDQVPLERKTFAMGLRIEHLQRDVDECQYGPAAGDPRLGAAPYKLVSRAASGRSAFTFCMCPGGEVVAAASEAWGVVTNGMSLHARDGINANAGLLANVTPEDLPGDDLLAGMDLQRRCEHAAYEAGGGAFRAPVQLVGDFLQGVPSTGPGRVRPTYPRGVTWGSVEGCLPDYVRDALRANLPGMARKLRCFADADAVLTGVETRSSSPVRVVRDRGYQSVGARGLFPVGEGAGYAGGIMSAATDGIHGARAVMQAMGLDVPPEAME